MTKTEHCNLPQWGAEDPVRREDFNQAMADIDAGMNAAQEAAEAAQETAGAAYSPDNMPYVAGTYTGNYGTTTVELGFCPQLLIIAGDSNSSSQSGRSTSLGSYFGVIGGDHNYETVTLSGTGFSVRNGTTYPELNEGNITYLYIAFR